MERPSPLLVAWAGLAGAAWGVGLARLIAEAGCVFVLYSSPWAVAGLATLCGLLLALAWARFGRGAAPLAPLVLPLLYVVQAATGTVAGVVLVLGSSVLALLLACERRFPWAFPVVLALTVFALYVGTMLPSVGQADTLEFQVVVPLLRVAHPTGYPLYILLTHAFTWLPLGNVAWRVSLASVVYATGTVLALYLLMNRLTGRAVVACLAAFAFATSEVFWSQAIVAEVYTLHNLLVVLSLWLLLAWRGRPWRWPVLALLTGLSLTNHLTTVLVLPAVALGLLWERPKLSFKGRALSAGLFLAGLAVYLYIPLRWPAVNRGEWMSLGQFVAHVTGQQFGGAWRWDGWREAVRWRIVGRLLLSAFGWPGVGLALAGLAGWLRQQRKALVLTGVIFLAFLVYGLNYSVPDVSVFLIPAILMLALWIAAGIALLLRVAEGLSPRLSWLAALGIALAALLPFGQLWTDLPRVDRSQEVDREAWGRYVLDLPLAPDAVILADVERFAPLAYLNQVEGVRPDLEVVVLGSEELYRSELETRLAAGQPVYLARYLPHLAEYHLRSTGPLVEVSTEPLIEPPVPDYGLDVDLGGMVRLLGFDADGLDHLPSSPLRLILYWRAAEGVPADYVVRLRLVDRSGQVRWQEEGTRPVSGLYPTNAWRAGEVVPDFHELTVPPYLWGGTYRLQVGLFPPFGEEGLPANGGEAWTTLTTLVVGTATPPPLQNTLLARFSEGLWLTGSELPTAVTAGSPVDVTLAWRQVEPEPRGSLRLMWVDRQGGTTEAEVAHPLPGGLTGPRRTRHVVIAPQGTGAFTLRAGWVDEDGSPVPARCSWLGQLTTSCAVGPAQVQPVHEGIADFDGRVLLLSAEVGAETINPGGTVPVTLCWRGLQDMEEDYTVTVQLLGPDGRLHGQVDAWPVQGTFPTSQWVPGQVVADPYQVLLAGDAPPGRYQVVVGWYLLRTMERLPVVDEADRAMADHVVVGELLVTGP